MSFAVFVATMKLELVAACGLAVYGAMYVAVKVAVAVAKKVYSVY